MVNRSGPPGRIRSKAADGRSSGRQRIQKSFFLFFAFRRLSLKLTLTARPSSSLVRAT
jgi:hypothetical protein